MSRIGTPPQRRSSRPYPGYARGQKNPAAGGFEGRPAARNVRQRAQEERRRNEQRARAMELILEYLSQWDKTWNKDNWKTDQTYTKAKRYISEVQEALKFPVIDISDVLLTNILEKLKTVKQLYDAWINNQTSASSGFAYEGFLGTPPPPRPTPKKTDVGIESLAKSAKERASAGTSFPSPSKASPPPLASARKNLMDHFLSTSPSVDTRKGRRTMNPRRLLRQKNLIKELEQIPTRESPGGSGKKTSRTRKQYSSTNLASTLGQPTVW